MYKAIPITDNYVLNLIDKCCNNMRSWGFKLPEITWFENNDYDHLGTTTFLYEDGEGEEGGDKIKEVQIYLNDGLLKLEEKRIEKTIYHELAHVVAKEDDFVTGGHGPTWKFVTNIIKKHTSMTITISTDAKDLPNSYFANYKYAFRCANCGEQVGFMRATEFVKNYNKVDRNGSRIYTCAKCNGPWERIDDIKDVTLNSIKAHRSKYKDDF